MATVLAALLEWLRRDRASARRVLELVGGDDPVAEAVVRAMAGEGGA